MDLFAIYTVIYTIVKIAIVAYFMIIAWSIAASLKKIANRDK
jgi:hypothetical protein